MAPLPTARGVFAAATGPDGRIYALGGIDERGAALRTVEAYDVRTNTWSAVAPLPAVRSGHAAAKGPDGRIYALGGAGNGPLLAAVEAFTPGLPPTPRPTRPPRPTAKPTPPPPPSLTLDGVEALNTRYQPQRVFPRGASGYIRVRWAIRHLRRGAAGITIERRYYIPAGRGWELTKSSPIDQVVPAAGDGPSYQDSPFFAPLHYSAYRIAARIRFLGKWSASEGTTIRVR
jgi:hypothetical protein